MPESISTTIRKLTPDLRAGRLELVEGKVITKLRARPASPFHISIDLPIRNDPAAAARYFDHFFRAESRRLKIAAAYTEMNGFDINPDRWFFNPFAYTTDGGHGDYDWLACWQADDSDDVTITGLERLQDVYAGPAYRDPAHTLARDLCGLLVVIKFQRFIHSAATQMKLLKFPLYVTAHDYDFIAKFDPR